MTPTKITRRIMKSLDRVWKVKNEKKLVEWTVKYEPLNKDEYKSIRFDNELRKAIIDEMKFRLDSICNEILTANNINTSLVFYEENKNNTKLYNNYKAVENNIYPRYQNFISHTFEAIKVENGVGKDITEEIKREYSRIRMYPKTEKMKEFMKDQEKKQKNTIKRKKIKEQELEI